MQHYQFKFQLDTFCIVSSSVSFALRRLVVCLCSPLSSACSAICSKRPSNFPKKVIQNFFYFHTFFTFSNLQVRLFSMKSLAYFFLLQGSDGGCNRERFIDNGNHFGQTKRVFWDFGQRFSAKFGKITLKKYPIFK